jgi:molecular chaperone DnaK
LPPRPPESEAHMTRTTVDFGIDLGTTNSAIAVLKGGTTEIIKNSADTDFTLSAVSIDKKGTIHVGQRAKNRIIAAPEDTYIEFKRRMGTDHIYRFKSSGQERKHLRHRIVRPQRTKAESDT